MIAMFVLRRLLLAVPVLLGLALLVFLLTRVVPADPAAVLAGEGASPAQVAALRAQLGLDRALAVQFGRYLEQIAAADLGTSLYTHRAVSRDLLERLPATLELAASAMTLAIVLGIPLGLVAALHHNRVLDHLARLVSVTGIAIASFWLAIMLQLLFSMRLDLLPLRGRIAATADPPPHVTGLFTLDFLFAGDLAGVGQALAHLALPALTLALPGMATIARFMRSSALETLQKDHVLFARAAGLPRLKIAGKYVLRNSASATVTQIGLLFSLLLSGSIVVEAIFVWPGLGDYLFNAIVLGDYQPVLATTLLIGAVYTGVNIAVDLAQALIDPRVAERL